MENAIEIKNLCKNYGDFSLNNVTFSVPQGSIMGFIGENGAGKSTTIKAILNLIKKDSGIVSIMGMDSKEKEQKIRDEIGVVFEESSFHDNLNTKQISKIMDNIFTNWDNSLFELYLTKLKIPEKKAVKEFSRGMKMKLCIASAMAHHPKILILDEATSGLDPVVRDEILDIFLEFIQDETHSILISSHITSDLDKIADYITLIHNGTILFSEEKDELIGNMGILKCSETEFRSLQNIEIINYRKHSFGVEALISNKEDAITKYPNYVIDSTNLEEIMLYYVRGEK